MIIQRFSVYGYFFSPQSEKDIRLIKIDYNVQWGKYDLYNGWIDAFTLDEKDFHLKMQHESIDDSVKSALMQLDSYDKFDVSKVFYQVIEALERDQMLSISIFGRRSKYDSVGVKKVLAYYGYFRKLQNEPELFDIEKYPTSSQFFQ